MATRQALRQESLELDLEALDVQTVELPGEALVEAMAMGLGNTEVGASGTFTGGHSWLV